MIDGNTLLTYIGYIEKNPGVIEKYPGVLTSF